MHWIHLDLVVAIGHPVDRLEPLGGEDHLVTVADRRPIEGDLRHRQRRETPTERDRSREPGPARNHDADDATAGTFGTVDEAVAGLDPTQHGHLDRRGQPVGGDVDVAPTCRVGLVHPVGVALGDAQQRARFEVPGDVDDLPVDEVRAGLGDESPAFGCRQGRGRQLRRRNRRDRSLVGGPNIPASVAAERRPSCDRDDEDDQTRDRPRPDPSAPAALRRTFRERGDRRRLHRGRLAEAAHRVERGIEIRHR
ncbi:MAG: hypothetical protein JJE52_02435 [Acidimicrobiia bacterium]|nr:hypothetical protein [Acidimicrobiia bacterium]